MRLILKGVNNIDHSFPFEFHNHFAFINWLDWIMIVDLMGDF